MNEQLIQKLVDETGLKDILADHVKKYPGLYQEPIEEFAGLIVRECAKVAKKVDGDEGDDYKSGRTWAGIDVLKHFGVEE